MSQASRRCFVASAVAVAAALASPVPVRAAPTRVDGDALTALLARAKATHSDGLTVIKGGELVLDYHTPLAQPIESMSVTKSIVSLAIGMLIDDGKLTLETALNAFYPQWRDTPRAAITVRDVVAHTSGIATKGAPEKYAEHTDFVQYALMMDLDAAPGTLFAYNNLAYMLLPDIVRKTSGKPIDNFLGERLFRPLGIEQYHWLADPAGNRLGMAGLQIRPRDLASIGQLMAQRGNWKGQQLVSERWVDIATHPQSAFIRNVGMFWWLKYERSDRVVTDADIARWRAAGIPTQLVDRVAALRNQALTSDAYSASLELRLGSAGLEQWARALAAAHTAGASTQWGDMTGYAAQGSLGQYLLVYPAAQLVISRMIDQANAATQDDGFPDIFELGAKLAGVTYA